MSIVQKPFRRSAELVSVERYTLDLRKTRIPEDYLGTLLIPVCRGKYRLDYDVLMDELHPAVQARMTAIADEKFREQGVSDKALEKSRTLPVGFDLLKLPPGAVLVRGYLGHE